LRDLLGWTANISTTATTAVVADNEARYTWRPDVATAERPASLTTWWEEQSQSTTKRARDGTIYSGVGPTLYGASIAYQYLASARVIIPDSGSVNIELQQFYVDVFAAAARFRVYPDDTATTSSDFVTGVLGGFGEELPSFRSLASPSEPPSHTHWDVQFTVWKDV